MDLLYLISHYCYNVSIALQRNQKEILVKKGMNPDDYMLHSEDEKEMILYNRKEKRLEAVEK